MKWAPKEQRVVVYANDGRICSHAALLRRQCLVNGEAIAVAGIGSVATHPEFRGQGFATAALLRAKEVLQSSDAEIGVLFCAPKNVSFYERLEWRKFDGDVLIAQPDRGVVSFPYAMALPLRKSPSMGTFDACGLPW